MPAFLEVSYSQTELRRSVCKAFFEEFVREFWPHVPGAGKLIWNWHISYLCDQLQIVAERVFNDEPNEYDVVFNVSPGTSKSTVCSILFPCWVWTRMPHARILTASHTHELVLDLATKARDVIKNEVYKELFPEIVLCQAQDTKGYYRNTLGGDRLTCTVGGKSPMGFHAHFLIVDDPIDPKKAVSEVEIRNAKDFMTNVLPTRKVNKETAVTFLIMQRLDREDPTAVQLENAKKEDGQKVFHVCLPAELLKGDDGAYLPCNVNPPELARRYVDGLMDPVRLSRRVLRRFKATLGRYGYASQFEQSPVPLEGGMFELGWFNQRVRAAPYHARRIRFWDRAATADAGCATAGVLMACDLEGRYYVEHVEYGQWEPNKRNAIIVATALKDRARYGPHNDPQIVIEAERGSTGLESFQNIARKLAGFRVKEDMPTGSKDVRAEPWADQLAAMNVWCVEDGTWDINGYVQEHCLFRPDLTSKRLGGLKDRVDGSSGAFNLLAGVRMSGTLQIHNFRAGKAKGQRVVICDKESLADLHLDARALLISIQDPDLTEVPVHQLEKLTELITLNFADYLPEELQDRWELPVHPYNKLPPEIIMRNADGKKFWSAILRKRDPNVEVIVIQDSGDRRASSLAFALCDSLGLPRNSIYCPKDPEDKCAGKPQNQHVYDVTKLSRALVVG